MKLHIALRAFPLWDTNPPLLGGDKVAILLLDTSNTNPCTIGTSDLKIPRLLIESRPSNFFNPVLSTGFYSGIQDREVKQLKSRLAVKDVCEDRFLNRIISAGGNAEETLLDGGKLGTCTLHAWHPIPTSLWLQ